MKARGVDRRVLIAGAVVAVLVVALVVVLAVTRAGGEDAAAPEPVTVTYQADAVTPEVAPVERETGTELLAALPSTVAGYAVTEQTGSPGLMDRFALEAWRLTYSGADADVVVQVGQWPTGAEALEAYLSLRDGADGEELSRTDVEVDGEAVGQVVVVTTDDGERAIWRNGTAVLVADGPADAVTAFYEAFPL